MFFVNRVFDKLARKEITSEEAFIKLSRLKKTKQIVYDFSFYFNSFFLYLPMIVYIIIILWSLGVL